MKRLIFDVVDFLIGPVRYRLSDVEFDEPIYIEAYKRANHLATSKYHLCKIFALLFEYACELVICFYDIVSVQVPVVGKEHVLIIPCQIKKSLRLDTEGTKSLNSIFVKLSPSSITVPRCN
jgi:hypothetical protein